MSQYIIEKGIPVPRKYPFADMEVGDSFLVGDTVHGNSVYRIASLWGKKLNRKFSCRTVEGGVRVWRVE